MFRNNAANERKGAVAILYICNFVVNIMHADQLACSIHDHLQELCWRSYFVCLNIYMVDSGGYWKYVKTYVLPLNLMPKTCEMILSTCTVSNGDSLCLIHKAEAYMPFRGTDLPLLASCFSRVLSHAWSSCIGWYMQWCCYFVFELKLFCLEKIFHGDEKKILATLRVFFNKGFCILCCIRTFLFRNNWFG